ncbi:hypothetical protein [Treponema sp.]|uniref:hypothetical protein n=1 Tax=Treponema sp. TaxID=166 RepID=UPI00298E543A|nr:hypothetical protein [Treponema sp.]MCR5613543.1 hypothetical protein [Treponema sp.]
MDSIKKYVKVYLYSLALMVLSALLIAISGALDINSEKYRAKIFILGTVLFFYGMTFFIAPVSDKDNGTATFKEFANGLMWDGSTAAVIFRIVYPIIGLALAIYIMIGEQWHLAAGFAKLTIIVSCVGIAIRAVICSILSLLKKRNDFGDSQPETEELGVTRQPEPIYVNIILLVFAAITGFVSYKAFMMSDFNEFAYEYKMVNEIKNNSAYKIFTSEFLEKEIDFGVATENGTDHIYIIDLNDSEKELTEITLVKNSVRSILEAALEEDAKVIVLTPVNDYILSYREIGKILKSSNAGDKEQNEKTSFFYFGDAEDLFNAVTEIYNSDMTVVIDDSNIYEHKYIPIWDLPTYCEIIGIDVNSDNWFDEVKNTGVAIASIQDLFISLYNDSDYESRNGFIMNYGTKSSTLIPYSIASEIYKNLNPQEEESDK